MTARDYAEFGAWEEALAVLQCCTESHPLLKYYEARYLQKEYEGQEGTRKPVSGLLDLEERQRTVSDLLDEAEHTCPDYCFPNKTEDIAVLRFASDRDCPMAKYYLGNLYYDRRQWEEAVSLWEQAEKEKPEFPTVHRNLALAYYNKCGEPVRAREELEKAFALNKADARVFLELDQLYKKLGMSFADRLARYGEYPELVESRDDLYVEYVTLLNMTGQYEKAYEAMMGHRFHPWEGGEGKITTQYVLSLLQMAKKALSDGQADAAEEFLRKALVYPENLGEGRLEGTRDNHLYYHLGLACERQAACAESSGDKKLASEKREEARQCFERATTGTDEPAGAMYYNDQPADMILYQGLAYLKLGRTGAARSRFYRLIDYGEQHLEDQVKIEYFAVSLPDFLIFEDDLNVKNRAHCYYLMALGNLGLGDVAAAKAFLEDALKLEPSHMMANIYRTDNNDCLLTKPPKCHILNSV
jgi:tetratricopeptide (TPR) repeat protein